MRNAPGDDQYLLGVNKTELERLRFQHSVWGDVTRRFLQRVNVRQGWKCLDAGSGPGFVAMDIRELVGEEGEVTLLDPSEFYLDWFRGESERNGWSNTISITGTAEGSHLPRNYYDFIFSRWVIDFVPDPGRFLDVLVSTLRPGGIIALQDYAYEGLALYPRGGAFEGMADAVRRYYASGGGDAYAAAKVPTLFRTRGVEVTDFTPNCLAGGPESGIFEWAHRFFSTHTQVMVDRKVISQGEGDAMVADWLAHRANPEALFFSPIVVDVAGVKSAT
jgi:SAM-dependent methyltransferase